MAKQWSTKQYIENVPVKFLLSDHDVWITSPGVTSKTATSVNKAFQSTTVFMREVVDFEVVSGCAECLELKTMTASCEWCLTPTSKERYRL